MNLFSRKKVTNNTSSNKGKKTNFISKFNEFSRSFIPWLHLAVFIILLSDIYVIASIFSLWTGAWGQIIRRCLIGYFGGSVLIFLIYIGYVCTSFLLRKRISSFFRQFVGTVILFFCGSHVLGLFGISGMKISLEILSPGKVGRDIAFAIYTRTGALGAFFSGLLLALISSVLYGFINPGVLLERTMSVLSKIGTCGERIRIYFSSMFSIKPDRHLKKEPEKESAEDSDYEINDSPLQNFSEVHPAIKVAAEEETDIVTYDNSDADGYFVEDETLKDEEDNGSNPDIEPGLFPPPLDLFGHTQANEIMAHDKSLIEEQGHQVISTLGDFGIQAELAETVIGPTVIQFQLQLAPGVKVSRVAGLSNDLAVSLAVPALRVEAPIPFKPYVGIEIPAPNRRAVSIRSILETKEFMETRYQLPLPAGLKVNSAPLLINLEDLPHLLVAGTTGSGKSVFITSCITGLCCKRTPEELRLLMIDPKRVELNIYEHLPHVLCKPVVDAKKAVHALGWAVREMEHRYEVFARSRVRNLASYNSKVLPKDRLPRIVIIVDELADLMFTAQKEVEDFICRLAQMARATGIHLILATQRPSVNVITGLIKANIPARVAFTLPSQADSRTIIDVGGAEKLLGKGDMLFVSSKYPRPVRVQAPFMDENQSMNFINYMKDLFGEPEYVDIEDQGEGSNSGKDTAFLDDPLIEEAVNIILNTGIASASRLQRQLRIGFTRAARIIDTLEQIGIVGPQEGSKPREILVDEDEANEILQNNN